MTITAVNKAKLGFEIEFDTKVKYVISEQLFSSFRFYLGKAIEENEYEKFLKLANLDQIHQKALSILARKMLAKGELKRKLKDFTKKNNLPELDPITWQNEFDKLTELGLLNDEKLITYQIQSLISKSKGKNYIKQKLAMKGFDKDLISEKLSNFEENDDELEKILVKKFEILKSRKLESGKLFEKLVRFGLSRGFESGKVVKVAKRLVL